MAQTQRTDDSVARLDWLIAGPALPATSHRDERYSGTAGRTTGRDRAEAAALATGDAEHATVDGVVLRDQTAGALGLTDSGRCSACGKEPGRWQPSVGGRRDELVLRECPACGAAWTGRDTTARGGAS